MLRQGVQGISDIITMPGLINLDFADVRAIMKDAGSALMGIGRASRREPRRRGRPQAIASPLLEVDINGAQGILFNITGSVEPVSLFEVTEAAEEIRAAADPEANIIFGTSFNERLGDEVMITVIATGFDGGRKRHASAARGDRRHGHVGVGPRRRASATSSRSSSASATRSVDGSAATSASSRRRRRPPPSAAPRVERSVGEPAPPSAPRPTTPTTWRSRASFAGSEPAGW